MGQITLLRTVVISTATLMLVAGCAPQIAGGADDSADTAELGPLPTAVPTSVYVGGTKLNVETQYLPAVVACENPLAPAEAMKAQAVAARTWLTANSGGKDAPTVSDSTSAQVYSCAANNYGKSISLAALAAVRATRGEVVLWHGEVTAGFFVAGAERDPDTCRNASDATNTEHYVTYNFGYIGKGVRPSSLGSWRNATNRGCLSQNMANCLADTTTYDYRALLRYFYGSDIQVAHFGAPPLDDSEQLFVQMNDQGDNACFSTVFYRPAPRFACLQSGSGKTWYQCLPGGSFVKVGVDDSGLPVGASEPCSINFSL